jgi:lipid A 3-O-deacylase|tara:strand:+ start:1436 stop:2452 length:1017 start_codon:yes stop_codon:yes gene_type:complete
MQANGSSGAEWQTIVQWDNDLIMAGTDQDYTNGTRIAFQRELPRWETPQGLLKDPLRELTGANRERPGGDLRLSNRGPLRYAWGIGLTQLMYTPRDPGSKASPTGERPYAGWLGMEFSLQAMNDNTTSGITLSIGTTGDTSMAEDTQDWVHQNISDSPLFQGWDSQVPQEVTINLHFDHKRRLDFLEHGKPELFATDGYSEWGLAGGNFNTHAYIGSLLRFGYNLPSTHSTPRVQLGSYGAAFFKKEPPAKKAFSILGFSGLRGSFVLHDITLDGPIFRESRATTESKKLVGEWLFGIQLRWNRFDLSLSNTLRSDEFKGQQKSHRFGSAMLRWHHRY